MKIQKDNGKDIIILNDDEIIIKGIFKDKIVKRDNILSACLLEDLSGNKGLVILTKDFRIVKKRSINLRWSDREKLKLIINEININNILFNYKNNEDAIWIFNMGIYVPVMILGNFFDTYYGKYICLAIYVVIISIIIAYYHKMDVYKGIIYDLKNKEFQVVNEKKEMKNKFTMKDIEVNKIFKNDIYRYKVKNSDYTFCIQSNTISYPIEYERLKDELKNSH